MIANNKPQPLQGLSKGHTVNNSQIAHLWAHNTDETKSRQGSSFYFDGLTIYSYGPHFPIARHVERKGRKAVLFTTKGYSMSTQRHMSLARQAIPHDVVFNVESVTDKPDSAHYKAQYEVRLKGILDEASRSRSNKPHHIERALHVLNEANQCAEFFGWRWRLTADVDKLLAESKEQAEKQKAKDKAERAKFDALHAKALPYWRRHAKVPESIADPYQKLRHKMADYSRVAWLRLSPDRQTVETSKGATVPASRVEVIWAQIQRAIHGLPLIAANLSIGDFHVDHIETNGDIKAGCHFIPYAESEYIAKELSLA